MKTYNVSWYESIRFNTEIEAKDEKEAEKKFLEGDYNFGCVEQEDGTYEEESVVVSETEEI